MRKKPAFIHLRGDPAELAVMRDFVTDWADESGLGSEQAFGACLVATEAVTNAMRHASPGGEERPITLTCRLEGCDFVLEVIDRGRFRSERPREDDHGGRGLFLIRELTRSFDLRAGQDGTQLVMRLPVEAPVLAGPRAA